MEKIEIEFQKHKVPEDIQSRILDDTYLALNIGDIAKEYFKEEKRVKRLLIRNKFLQQLLNAYGCIGFNVSNHDQCLKEDEEYLTELIEHIEDHEDYLIEILEVLSKDNWQKMLKVLDFSVIHYASNYNYIQGNRKGLEYALSGIQYCDNRNQDTRKEFKEWFQKTMECEKNPKELEKK